MYLHIGNNMNIRTKDIIGIFDTDNATRSALTKKFLKKAELSGSVEAAAEKFPNLLYYTGPGLVMRSASHLFRYPHFTGVLK